MKIRPSKGVLICLIILWIIGALIFPLLLYVSSAPIGFIIALSALLNLYMLRCAYTFLRTIEIDRSGCTVRFLFFRRHYTWSELRTKRIEDYRHRLFGRGDVYEKGVVFSTRENFHTPEMISILAHLSACINPFCFFVVLFKPSAKNGLKVYEVDEQEFMSIMKEYGVDLD